MTEAFKLKLFEECKSVLALRVENAKYAMEEAQLSANGEEKSSAGDKFETSRAMGHRDREMFARQFVEARNELQKMELLRLEPSTVIKAGSLILTDSNLYFIATGIGKLIVDGQSVFVVSAESPKAKLLLGKAINDEFVWNNVKSRIEELF